MVLPINNHARRIFDHIFHKFEACAQEDNLLVQKIMKQHAQRHIFLKNSIKQVL
jgi:hypothetical protein